MKPLPGNDVCCGFGGTFCVKYPDISNAIVGEKAKAVEGTGAEFAARRGSRLPDEYRGQACPRMEARYASCMLPKCLAGMGDSRAIGEED